MAFTSKTSHISIRRYLKIAVLGASSLGLLLTSAACTGPSSTARLKPLKTYTTYYPNQNYTRPVAIGDTVRISGLNGELATSRAGQALLEKYGYWDQPESLARATVSYQRLSVTEDAYEAPSEKTSAKLSRSSGGMTERILITAYSQSGQSYRAGGKSPETGFDASGFAHWVYRQNGVRVGQTAKDMMSSGAAVTRDNLHPGDLLIYRNPNQADQYHVGIYTGSGNFIHAPKAGETITESAAFGPQYENSFITARRLYNDPKSAPLSRQRKNEITSEAIKTALAQKSFASSATRTRVAANDTMTKTYKTAVNNKSSKRVSNKSVKTRYKMKAGR